MAGVYISYPFCSQKCSFCNFASGVFPQGSITRYHRALLDEVRAHKWHWDPETVYFGGGTPSLMPVDLLCDLMSSIPGESLSEVTLECAPGTIPPPSIEAWQRCGVNRVSLGVQSFVTEELHQTGRRHNAAAVQDDIAALRKAGVQNINVDLIAGLPRQTSESWKESLDWIEGLAPPHVSIYIFEIDEDSRLGKEAILGGRRYGAESLPGDDLTAELYERAVERLAEMGLARYEISNFAREGWQSRHNLKYWQLEPYVGFGLDAHSFDGIHRWSNPDELETYLKAPRHELTEIDSSEEHFFVGLRLMRGIEPTAREWSRFAQPIERFLHNGMLERKGERLCLTNRGVLLSNEVFQEFVNV